MNEFIPPITALLYHDVLPSDAPRGGDKGSIRIDVLTDHIRVLKGSGIEVIDLQTAMQSLASPEPDGGAKKCVITFDDAMEGVYRFLPELLREFNIPVTVFVITDYVGKQNDWNTRTPVTASHMSLPELMAIHDRGVDLELHGKDHHNLLKFSEDELEERFEKGIEWFQLNFGNSPRYLSYPYGACNAMITGVAARYFEGALSVNHGLWWGAEARWKLNRISVPSYVGGNELAEVLATVPDKRWLLLEKMAPWWNKQAE